MLNPPRSRMLIIVREDRKKKKINTTQLIKAEKTVEAFNAVGKVRRNCRKRITDKKFGKRITHLK